MGKKLPDNVALEKAAQSSFTNAMNTIKALVKKGEAKVDDTKLVVRKKKVDTGVVYLSHVPHGFYEPQMQDFFSQFGVVTRLKLGRSKKSGKSLGFAFIEFLHKEVAEIVAETMNNYLMFTKLIKAQYVPHEKVTDGMFFGRPITAKNYPGLENRNKNRRASNRILTGEEVAKKERKARGKLTKMQAKLEQLGVDYKIQLGGKAKLLSTSLDKKKEEINTEEEVKIVDITKKRRKSEATSEGLAPPVQPKKKRVSVAPSPKSPVISPKIYTRTRSQLKLLNAPAVTSPKISAVKRQRKSLAPPVVAVKKPARKSLPNKK